MNNDKRLRVDGLIPKDVLESICRELHNNMLRRCHKEIFEWLTWCDLHCHYTTEMYHEDTGDILDIPCYNTRDLRPPMEGMFYSTIFRFSPIKRITTGIFWTEIKPGLPSRYVLSIGNIRGVIRIQQ